MTQRQRTHTGPSSAEALWLEACDQFYGVLNRQGERAAKMLAYAALVAMMPNDGAQKGSMMRRTPTADTKPTAPPPTRPPREASADRKASIKRAAAIIARVEGTTAEVEEAKLTAIVEAGL